MGEGMVELTNETTTTLYKPKFCSKKCNIESVTALGLVDGPDFHNYVLIEILLKKMWLRKCEPLGPMDRPDFHNYVLIEILLKKVRLRKCDPKKCEAKMLSHN